MSPSGSIVPCQQFKGEAMDQAQLLPDDVLARVFRCLAPCSLAASRCVCRAWCRVIDDRRLLRAALLPHRLGGIFLNLHDLWFTQFLSRPTTGTAISGRLDYTVPGKPDFLDPLYVHDHCNGLLLLDDCVVNPATKQWALLPPHPPLPMPRHRDMHVFTDEYLVFDPTLSPDFEVLILPCVPSKWNENEECEESEWPPNKLILPMFSSKSGSWEERAFGREGEAAGMLPRMVRSAQHLDCQNGYWRGALYICCKDWFVMRISLSDNKYRVIRLPTEGGEFYLGKSIKGIYCASLFQGAQLRVWFLNDQCGPCLGEWVLKHDIYIFPILPNLNYGKHCDGPWIIQAFDYLEREGVQYSDVKYNNEAILEEKFEWDSDNDSVLEPGKRSKDYNIVCLGFHPYKEVVFLSDTFNRVLAYNWSSSKVQYLGKLFPKFYTDRTDDFYPMVTESFPYTPCWLGELPEKLNSEAQLKN